MRSGMKMLMISGQGGSNDRNDMEIRRGGGSGGRSEMGMGYGGQMGYGGGAESRFRDRQGREHYDNGRFAPMRGAMDDMEDNYGMESRRGRNIPIRSSMEYAENNYGLENRRGRNGRMRGAMDDMEDAYAPGNRRGRRYSDGRFAPRSEMEMGYSSPFVPPIYEGGERSMNPIGFVPNGFTTYAVTQPRDEMEHRTSHMERGGAMGHSEKLTHEMAEEWMSGLENEDGSKGPHWNLDQAKQVMAQRGIQLDPYEFAAVINALYSDYSKVFQKHNVNKIDLYADLACAWINDRDAVPNKAAAYFLHVSR